jgi:hypothetical protein
MVEDDFDWGQADHGPPETPYVSGDEALSGASRTTGGFSRGRAFGNVPNIGDGEGQYDCTCSTFTDGQLDNFDDQDSQDASQLGQVLLFTSRDPSETPMSMMYDIRKPLPAVLSQIGTLYSPIRSECTDIYINRV